jgi:putative nucleotidyltransferase with HDIG domain
LKKDNQDLTLIFFCVCSFLVASLVVPARMYLPFNDFPNQYIHAAFPYRSGSPARIVAVAIDDNSFNKISDRWPWPRSVYADLLKNLDREGVRVIGFDVVFKGASENSEDARLLAEAMQALKAKVVLGYDFDVDQWSPGALSVELPKQSYIPGMLNTLTDPDGVIRQSAISYRSGSQVHYSFSVMIASAFSGKTPASLRIVKERRFQKSRNPKASYFYIDYRISPYELRRSIPIVSLYDCLHSMDTLKSEWGEDFLKDSIVIVYPAAAIRHDIHSTPVGKLPGGFIHINSIINILSDSGVDASGYFTVLLMLLSATALFFALRANNFRTGLVVFTAVVVYNFIAAFLLWSIHIKTDFAKTIVFSGMFGILAGAYKSIEFMARLNAIKDRATVDPLRGVYTLRYFRYRLELEARRRMVPVIMVYLEHFKESSEDMPINRLQAIWGRFYRALSKMRGCWACYSTDEIIGFMSGNQRDFENTLETLRSDLNGICASLDLKVTVKICSGYFKKDSVCADVFTSLSRQARSLKAGVLLVPDSALEPPHQTDSGPAGKQQSLDGLAEDIEEKNRQLLNLYERLKAEHGKTKEAFYQIIASLVNALEARDPYTQGHSQRVANYALALADRLGWPQDQKERLRRASLLHDLGKIGITDAILHKKGKLTDEEFGFIKQHEILGVNILKPLKDIEDILPWILYHHEKWDGTGYPHGLGGDAIPLASQIIALSDVFDALTTGRDYKAAVNRADAIAIILQSRGTHFNPSLADMFVAVISQTNP